mmetsp:Transcript_965/g.6070  ORF Transcript_965/g.6070 Transcript_965/m.6070 type:complete len:162 (-) Transcript_965:54-539(-)
MLKLFLAPVPLNMSLNLLGIRRAVFTESSTFSCTTLLLVKYLDNSLDLLYNLGNPYVCASTSVLCRTRRRPGRTKDDVSPAHNQASRIGASAFRYLHTYVSYRQCCEFLGDGKRQHFSDHRRHRQGTRDDGRDTGAPASMEVKCEHGRAGGYRGKIHKHTG